jgi:curved DNA-binding protein CbpA
MKTNFYQILGVLDDAEDVVIRAAYKALAQRYHPDKWTGNKEEANRRMQEINEAYEVLSDAIKRKKYDAIKKDNSSYSGMSNYEKSKCSKISLIYEPEMVALLLIYPELKKIESYLVKIDKRLQSIFRTYLFAIRNFEKLEDIQLIADHVKNEFLKIYFGNNHDVIDFAEKLILEKNKDAAFMLNDLIYKLGSKVPADKVIKLVVDKFPDSKLSKSINSNKKASEWEQKFRNESNYHNAFYYLKSVGSPLQIIKDATWGKYWTLKDGEKLITFQSEYSIIQFVKEKIN